MSIDDESTVDFTDTETVPFQQDGQADYPVLKKRQRRNLKDNLQDVTEAVIDEFLETARLWKLSTDEVETTDYEEEDLKMAKYLHEATFANLLEASLDCRYANKFDVIPCEDRTKVAEEYRRASKRFVEEHFDEEDEGRVRLYRGFGFELPYLVRDMLRFPGDDDYNLQVSVLSNHTIHRETAETFGLALFRRDIEIECVVFTPEFLLGPVRLNGEVRSHGEVQLFGDEIQTVDRTDVLVPDIDERLDTFVEKLRTAPDALSAKEHDVVRGIVEDMATRKERDGAFEVPDVVERILEAWVDSFEEHPPGGIDIEILNDAFEYVAELTEEVEPT